MMTLDEIISQCVDDSNRWFPEEAGDIPFLALATCGEAGEVANEVKKLWRTSQNFLDPTLNGKIREEIIDVFIYLMNLVGELDMDLVEEYQRKRDKNEIRFGKKVQDAIPSL